MNLLDLTIESLAESYRTHQLSPVEVTKAVLAEIAERDGALNSYASVTEELALAQAQTAERAFMRGEDHGPLQGVPINVKDNVFTAGIPTEVGSTIMRGFVPAQDADVVTRLKTVGAVMVGKANMLEFAYGKPHPAIGVTNNPWDLSCSVGGSSSGSGASIAAGLGFGSLGTDTGGSIRIPASYCGLVGLKPTYGLVSLEGVVPLGWSLDHIGPMTRSTYDNAAMLAAISDYPFNPVSLKSKHVARLRVAVLEMGEEIEVEVREAIERVCQGLKERGAVIVQNVQLEILDEVSDVLMGIMIPEASAAHDALLEENQASYHPTTRGRLELGSRILAIDYLRAQRYRNRLCMQVNAITREFDVLILPTTASAAPHQNELTGPDEFVRFTGPGTVDMTRFTGLFNLTGSPAMALPTGMSRTGLPLSMQLVGRPFSEAVLYQVAAACEEVTEWNARIAMVES